MKITTFTLLALISFCSFSQTESRVSIDSPEFSNVIQTLESGMWIWETGSCDKSQQSFKFDISSQTMTLNTKQSVSTDDRKLSSYRYEILWAWDGGFRSKIIGEERLDDNDNPIEWDLILIDHQSFYWRRNDWAKDTGTKTNIKCP